MVLLNKTGRSVVVEVKAGAFSTANQDRSRLIGSSAHEPKLMCVLDGCAWIILFDNGHSTENTWIHLLGFQVSYSTIVAIVNLLQF